MEYVSVKNLEKYLPGYKDRTLSWIKLYFRNAIDTKNNTTHTSIFNDEKFQELDEIDQIRFLKLACMQADTGKPVPMTDRNVAWMGWNTKKRPKSKTLLMLQSFLIVCNSPSKTSVPQNRIEKNRIEEDKEKGKREKFTPPTISQINEYCQEKNIYVDAKDFIDFYENKSWKVGRERMKDWRLAANRATKWEINASRQPPAKEDPAAEASRLEKQRQKIRDDDGKFFREQTI
ncbi:unnamed protein product, partial [marine sediment metagenome]